MADLNKIVTELYHDKEIDDCIRRYVEPYLFDDFKQELFLRLLEYGNKLIPAYEKSEHRYYVASIILSLINRSKDVFHKQYKTGIQELPENIGDIEDVSDISHRIQKEEVERRILEKIDQIEEQTGRVYYRLLIEALKTCGTYREISRQTGIPISSISNSMKQIRKYLCMN